MSDGQGEVQRQIEQDAAVKTYCERCVHKQGSCSDGGWCYMFRDPPDSPICGQFRAFRTEHRQGDMMRDIRSTMPSRAYELVPTGYQAENRRQIQRLSRLRCAAERTARQERYRRAFAERSLEDAFEAEQDADAEIERLRADRTACLMFIRNEMEWCAFRADPLGDNVSVANARKLAEFLDRFKAEERDQG